MATFQTGQRIRFESFGSQGRIEATVEGVKPDAENPIITLRVVSHQTYRRMVKAGISPEQAQINASHVIHLDEAFLLSPEWGDAELIESE